MLGEARINDQTSWNHFLQTPLPEKQEIKAAIKSIHNMLFANLSVSPESLTALKSLEPVIKKLDTLSVDSRKLRALIALTNKFYQQQLIKLSAGAGFGLYDTYQEAVTALKFYRKHQLEEQRSDAEKQACALIRTVFDERLVNDKANIWFAELLGDANLRAELRQPENGRLRDALLQVVFDFFTHYPADKWGGFDSFKSLSDLGDLVQYALSGSSILTDEGFVVEMWDLTSAKAVFSPELLHPSTHLVRLISHTFPYAFVRLRVPLQSELVAKEEIAKQLHRAFTACKESNTPVELEIAFNASAEKESFLNLLNVKDWGVVRRLDIATDLPDYSHIIELCKETSLPVRQVGLISPKYVFKDPRITDFLDVNPHVEVLELCLPKLFILEENVRANFHKLAIRVAGPDKISTEELIEALCSYRKFILNNPHAIIELKGLPHQLSINKNGWQINPSSELHDYSLSHEGVKELA